MAKAAGLASRNIRITVLVSVVLICGSFAVAAILQMQFGHEHELILAKRLETRRTGEIAATLADRLDRYAGLAAGYAENGLSAEAFLRAAKAGAPGLHNAALIAADGGAILRAAATPDFLPLPKDALVTARSRRTVLARGATLVLAFPVDGNVAAAEIDPRGFLKSAMLDNGAIAIAGGQVIAHGKNWVHTLLPDALSLPSAANRVATDDDGSMIGATTVPGWPLIVATAFDADGRTTPWYGWLPLYLFVVAGPAIAGAWLSVIFVREFERHARATAAIRKLRETAPQDARLLVRLAEAERRAVESERSRSEFVAHMSHELRTPLNAIIGFSEVIAQGFFGAPGHPKYIEYARDIGLAGRGLHDKIGTILEYANVEAGRYPIQCTESDLYAIACECVNQMAGRAFSRRITLSLDPSPPIRAFADPAAAKRILGNLIANALDYTPPQGRVRVLLFRQEDRICVRVRDTGHGFAPEEIADAGQAFKRFERSGTATGIGLGLAISVALAERMDGELRIAKNHGSGTTAELRLPKA